MRSLALAALLLSGLVLPSSAGPLPRGTDAFTLGMTRADMDVALARRGLERLSESRGILATTTDHRDGEFERYAFVRSPLNQVPVLYQAVTAFRFPNDLETFERVAAEVENLLGPPSDRGGAFDRDGLPVGLHQRTWGGGDFTVHLAARWTETPDARTDRMLLTWTDLRLARLAQAEKAKAARSER